MPLTQQNLEPFLEGLLNSYEQFFLEELLSIKPDEPLFDQFYRVPFVIVSHQLSDDPIFNFANLKAQELWESDWETFTHMPSRKSAELDERAEREKLLNQVRNQGYCNDYEGIRVSASGQRFMIQNAKVWNVLDSQKDLIGQAATFSHWELLSVP